MMRSAWRVHNERNGSHNSNTWKRWSRVRFHRRLIKTTPTILMPDVGAKWHWLLWMNYKNCTLTRILATTFAAFAAKASSQGSGWLYFCDGLVHTMLKTTCFCMLLTFRNQSQKPLMPHLSKESRDALQM